MSPRPVVRDWVPEPLGSILTPRETDVMVELLLHGSHKEAAACLGLSYQTTKNHASAIRGRLGATSLLEAVRLLGWVTLPADAKPHSPPVRVDRSDRDAAFLTAVVHYVRELLADGAEERCGREDAEKIAATAAERKP